VLQPEGACLRAPRRRLSGCLVGQFGAQSCQSTVEVYSSRPLDPTVAKLSGAYRTVRCYSPRAPVCEPLYADCRGVSPDSPVHTGHVTCFYVNNDLSEREDVRGIIQCPIWSRFGIRRPSIAIGNEVQVCLMAFNTVCTYIGTRDLVQEHIAYKVWPLVNEWEMPKQTVAGSSQGGLVYLRYTFQYRNQFDEPNDDWLDAIEATSDELLQAYTKAEDEAMTVAFGALGKRRLNRVSDVIGFVFPDYCFPARRQGGKIKIATSTSSGAPKPKKAKVQTRRLKLQSLEHTAVVPTIEGVKFIESAEVVPAMAAKAMEEVPTMPSEASADAVKVPKIEKTVEEHPKLLSPPVVAELPNLSTTATTTPRKRRMASVLDAVLELMKTPTPASVEASIKKIGDARKLVTASAASAHVEAGPSGVARVRLMEESLLEKSTSTSPEAPPQGDLEYIVRHASGKQLSSEQIDEVQHYART
jgi:hypothetical protein